MSPFFSKIPRPLWLEPFVGELKAKLLKVGGSRIVSDLTRLHVFKDAEYFFQYRFG